MKLRLKGSATFWYLKVLLLTFIEFLLCVTSAKNIKEASEAYRLNYLFRATLLINSRAVI